MTHSQCRRQLVAATIAIVTMLGLWGAGPRRAQATQLNSCALQPQSYSGRQVTTRESFRHRFVMLSAYKLVPYSQAYLTNALTDLARHRANGIVYASVGQISGFLRAKGGIDDEIAYNRMVFAQARTIGADLWLQLRVYGNRLVLPGSDAERNLTAEDIIGQPEATRAFRRRVAAEFAAYNDAFAERCVVIAFEEAGIYHHQDGGGRFWSSLPDRIRKPSARYDDLFAQRLAGVFRIVREEVGRINPRCRVGMHLGHSAFLRPEPLVRAIEGLRRDGVAPDLIFYDLYLKAQRSFEAYAARLGERKAIIRDRLRLPAYHLAQLHTMNAFQHGLGRTPSRAEIDRMMETSRGLGFQGYGYYTKNAQPTRDRSNDPMAPNERGQQTVYESSKDRWDYGLTQLLQASGVDLARRFDLVLHGRFGNDAYKVLVRDVGRGTWDVLGYIDPVERRNFRLPEVVVFRALESERYLAAGRKIRIRIEPARGDARGRLEGLYVMPSEPAEGFRLAGDLKQELERGDGLRDAWAFARRRQPLRGDATELELCGADPAAR